MEKRSFFEKVLFYISVPKCICCRKRLSIDERVYCTECKNKFFESIDRDCSLCGKLLSKCSCTPKYLQSHFVKKFSKIFRYLSKSSNEVTSSLIYSLKRNAFSDCVDFASELLTEAIANTQKLPEDTVVTNVPRRRKAIMKYGHDHSALIAKNVAKRLGLKYQLLLKSKAKTEQKHLTREERMENVVVVPKSDVDLNGKTVLIIDDVVTSGATMAGCASVIRSLGCKNINAAALAIAYRD